MLEEGAVAAANGPLAVRFGIPGKADTRSGIEEVAFQAAGVRGRADDGLGQGGKRGSGDIWGAPLTSTLTDAPKWSASTCDEGGRYCGFTCGRIGSYKCAATKVVLA